LAGHEEASKALPTRDIIGMFGNVTLPSWYKAETVVAEEPLVYTVGEAADALGVKLTTTKALIASGELKSYLTRRRRLVPRSAVEEYIVKKGRGSKR